MKWKEKKHKPRFLYPANIFFLYEAEMKTFSNEDKHREFTASGSGLKKLLK